MTHPNDRPDTKRKRDPRATRDRLVRSALELFTTVGFHASTTPQIASKAGVAEGTIYRHFKSKEQLLNQVYQAAVNVFREPLESSDTALPCRERMRLVASAWSEVAQSDPALVRLVFVRQAPAALDQNSRTIRAEFRSDLETILASGKSEGAVRPGSVALWADVWLQLAALALERVADGTWKPDDATTLQVVEAAWEAVAAASHRS